MQARHGLRVCFLEQEYVIAVCLSRRRTLSFTSGEAEQGLKRRNSNNLAAGYYELWLTLLRMNTGKQSVEANLLLRQGRILHRK